MAVFAASVGCWDNNIMNIWPEYLLQYSGLHDSYRLIIIIIIIIIVIIITIVIKEVPVTLGGFEGGPLTKIK